MKRVLVTLSALSILGISGEYEDGLEAYQSGNYKKAAELYQKAADQGYTSAQYNLALMYKNGEGVKQDKTKAYQYWVLAAKQGYVNSQENIDKLCKESPWACK